MTTKINNIKNIDNINYYIMIFIQLLIPIFFIDRVVSNLYNFDLLKFEYHNVLWILSPILVFIYLYKLIKFKILFKDIFLLIIIFSSTFYIVYLLKHFNVNYIISSIITCIIYLYIIKKSNLARLNNK